MFPQEITRVLLNLISNGFYAAMKRKAEMSNGYDVQCNGIALHGPQCSRSRNLASDYLNQIATEPDLTLEEIFDRIYDQDAAENRYDLGLSFLRSYDIIVQTNSARRRSGSS